MNLDDMLKEASIVDHSWYTNDTGLGRIGEPTVDEIVDNSKNPNNIKPELEVEWGTAGPFIDLDEPAGIVERNLPEEAYGDTDGVIVFARDLMNRGKMGKELTGALKARFDQGTLLKAKDGLSDLFDMEGIIGCIAVDGRGYKSCQEAIEAASQSPFKRYISHVIGCECGDPHMLNDSREMAASELPEMSGNSIDDFFGASDDHHEPAMAPHCRSTMLPMLVVGSDLPQNMVSDTMIDMMNVVSFRYLAFIPFKKLIPNNLTKSIKSI